MQGKSYRLSTPTLGIVQVDGQRLAVTVPFGAVVTVDAVDINGNRLVDVTWEGRAVVMFAQDLRERGKIVEGAF